MSFKFCPGCAAPIDKNPNFCSQCGFDLKSMIARPRSASPQSWGLIVALTIVVFGGLWFLQGLFIGKAPTQTHSVAENTTDDAYVTDEIRKAKEAFDKSPDDINIQKTYATSLWNKLADYENPPPQLIYQVIEVLSSILKTSPDEPQALLMMANISFNQKIFDKAVGYYQRYLTANKDDYEARSSYASALAFLGKHKDAIQELDIVIKSHPDYFQAIAYKAITLAQIGKTKEALELGNRAIAISPNDEARARFGGFLDSLKNSSESNPVEAFIKTHQIAGPKFVKSEMRRNSIILYFRDFPMSAMPPFAKDAFIAKVKVEAKKMNSLSEVVFIDSETGQEMYKFKVE